MSRSTGWQSPAVPPAASTSQPGVNISEHPMGTCGCCCGCGFCNATTSARETSRSIRAAFLFNGRRCFISSSHSTGFSLADLGLIPLHVHRNGHHQIRLPDQRFSILILFALRGGHYPDVPVAVAHELALGIGAVGGGREKSGGAEFSDVIFVVVAVDRIEF